ncbi:hypothetical protein LguiA_019220 [Lonicera macranthoides]
MGWSLRSSVDGSGLNPASPINKSRSRTRLIRALQSFQIKVNARIEAIRKDFPTKLLFFLVGFYCSTAFATIIGQTGDWDILAAALAMAVVEGIGFLTYKASLPLFDKARNLISMFNYWKAGLSLGLFLDSFKYELDNIFPLRNPFTFELDFFCYIQVISFKIDTLLVIYWSL